MTDLALEASLSGNIRLYDIDVQAAPRCDKELVYDVFPSNPLVKGRASVVDVKKLVDDMIANTAKCLPNGWCK